MVPQNQIKLQNLLEFSTPMEFMPDVGVENLQDMLAASEFEMPKSDRDYRLTQFQLIKVCKMLLHKVNIQNAKNELKHKDSTAYFQKLNDDLREKLKASVNELQTFLHHVNKEVDSHSSKIMDNRTEQNAKSSKLQEVSNKTLDALDDIKESVENSSTIISCLVEFNSMQ